MATTWTHSPNEVSASWTHSPNEVSASWTHSPNEVSASWTHSPNEVSASWTYSAGETAASWLETELMQFGFIGWEGVSYNWEDEMAYVDTFSGGQQDMTSGNWEDLG
tara:strand:- start:448 stop:768 length:321 start_codon:yes stop_codon:yes gene_type:complete